MKFIKKKILKSLINIDKVAYKEVNFKSKLLEWSQKNNIRLSYQLLKESKDESGSPTFRYKVMLENVEGCEGKGFSKKESQQVASKLTLEKLRKDSKFLDSVFASKTERTKMEEEPVTNVPKTEEPAVTNVTSEVNATPINHPAHQRKPRNVETAQESDFDLSDISMQAKSKEEIIALAESEAFNGNCQE